MAKLLRDLLNAEEPLFSLALRQLEMASGRPGEDVRLVGEIIEKTHAAIQQMGLDHADSTGRELFGALYNRIAEDNRRVASIIGAGQSQAEDVAAMMPIIRQAVLKLKTSRFAWVLKRSRAKSLLKAMPPRRLMQHLGYRSVDSLLKHEKFDEVYTAIRFSEGSAWLNRYNQLFKTVTPSDFETRDISIIIMDQQKYADLAEGFVHKKRHNITHSKELGTIVVVPMKQGTVPGLTLKSLPLMLHYINEIRLYSSFFKLKQVKSSFGRIVVDTLIADPSSASQMAGQNVHWRVIQRYFGKLDGENHPEDFEPHVHPEDLHWRRAEELLSQIDPAMSFWQGLDFVGRLEPDGPVSFNLMDVALAYSNQELYANRYVYHMRESLWNEIFMRYMGHKNLERQILIRLDNDMVKPEKLRPSA